jgi:hypothetical protein
LFQNQSAGHGKSKTDHQAKGGFLYHWEVAPLGAFGRPC